MLDLYKSSPLWILHLQFGGFPLCFRISFAPFHLGKNSSLSKHPQIWKNLSKMEICIEYDSQNQRAFECPLARIYIYITFPANFLQWPFGIQYKWYKWHHFRMLSGDLQQPDFTCRLMTLWTIISNKNRATIPNMVQTTNKCPSQWTCETQWKRSMWLWLTTVAGPAKWMRHHSLSLYKILKDYSK